MLGSPNAARYALLTTSNSAAASRIVPILRLLSFCAGILNGSLMFLLSPDAACQIPLNFFDATWPARATRVHWRRRAPPGVFMLLGRLLHWQIAVGVRLRGSGP